MKRFACLFALVCLIGCGGGGGTSVPSPFAGQWIGTWSAPSIPNTGTANITIATSGQVSGTVHDNGTGGDGTVTGTINNNGVVNGTVQYPLEPSSSITGTLTVNGSGHLVGSLVQQGVGVNFDLTPQ